MTSPLREQLSRHGFRLGEWTVEPRRNRLVGPQGPAPLDPKLMDLLLELAAARGQVLTRPELLDAVWPGTFVGENSLSQAISRLRKALGDTPRQPRFIETINKSGYRVRAEVVPLGAPPERTGRRARMRSDGARLVLVGAAAVAALALVGWVVAADRSSSPEVWRSLDDQRLLPQVTLPGNQFEPSLSPQGTSILFAWHGHDEGDWDIWRHEIGADHPTQMTRDARHERAPAWMPDGRSFVFVRFSSEEGFCAIYEASVDSFDERKILDCPGESRTLAVSPDGSTLALDVLPFGSSGPRALHLADLATGSVTPITQPPSTELGDTGPRFSPDGEWLVFERELTQWRTEVLSLHLTTGHTRQLTRDRWAQVRGVDWSADGRNVLYSSNRSGRYELWSVSADGGEPRRAGLNDEWVTQPSVARMTNRLIYRTFRDAVHLWQVPLSRAHVPGEATTTQAWFRDVASRRLVSSRSERQPSWSPSAERVAFVSDRSGTNEIWSARLDGSDAVRHTSLGGPGPSFPVVSPDGASIVFESAHEGSSDLYRASISGDQLERLTSGPADERNATFSSDGKDLYFTSNRRGDWDIWRMPVSGEESVQVTTSGAFFAQEASNGEALYSVRLDEPGIWLKEGDREAIRVVDQLELWDWGSWLVHGDGLIFVRRNPTRIVRWTRDGGERTLWEPTRQIPYLSRPLAIAPDGKHLLVALIEYGDDEILLAEGIDAVGSPLP